MEKWLGEFEKTEGEGWRRILCGGAEGGMWDGRGVVRKGGGYCAEGQRENERKVESGYGGAENIVRNGREAVRNGRGRMRERWRVGAERRRGNGR